GEMPAEFMLFTQARLTWNEAHVQCQQVNMTLATLDKNSTDYIKALIDADWLRHTVPDDFWIGLHDTDVDDFSKNNTGYGWAGDCQQLMSTSGEWGGWGNGEPQATDTNWCVTVANDTGDWQTSKCDERHSFMCQRKIKERKAQDLTECLRHCETTVSTSKRCWFARFAKSDDKTYCILIHHSGVPVCSPEAVLIYRRLYHRLCYSVKFDTSPLLSCGGRNISEVMCRSRTSLTALGLENATKSSTLKSTSSSATTNVGGAPVSTTEATSTTKSISDVHITTESGYDVHSTTESGNDVKTMTESGNDVHSTTERMNGMQSTTESGNEVQSTTVGSSDVQSTTEIGSDVHGTTEIGNDVDSTTISIDDVDSTTEIGSGIHSTTEDGNDVHTTETGYDVHSTTEIGTDVHSMTEIGNDVDSMTEIGNDVDSTTNGIDDVDSTTTSGNDVDSTTSPLTSDTKDTIESTTDVSSITTVLGIVTDDATVTSTANSDVTASSTTAPLNIPDPQRPLTTVSPFEISSTAPITVSATSNPKVSRNMCGCRCLLNATPPTSMEAALKAADDVKKELKVDVTSLTSLRRRKESAPDPRPSSTHMGVMGVVLIVAVLVFVMLSDLRVVVRHLAFGA
ncbi:hypothetical protein BaRGS_00038575, partial [Batillaria attramentaria]